MTTQVEERTVAAPLSPEYLPSEIVTPRGLRSS
jgi:hypothetical protein